MKKYTIVFTALGILLLTACGTKEEIAKLRKQVKYSTNDSDRDGVANIHDKDNSTAPEVKVYGDGTAVDTDMDGVSDADDLELLSPRLAKVDSMGRASDTDGDGVADGNDMEANTASGQMVNFQGKSIAAASSAPSTAGVGGANMTQFPMVLFVFRSEMENTTYPAIVAMSNYMKANPTVKINVIGHTDGIGDPKDNITLGEKRANVVIGELGKLGIASNRLVSKSEGEGKPLNIDYAKMNRRVEFSVAK